MGINIWSVQYNAENRPVVWSNVTGVVVEMDYDHMGRRIHKKIYNENGIQSHLRFIYDGYLQIAEIETNLVTTTFWDATESIATRPLAIISGSTPYLFTHDLTKNTMEILSQDGELETSYDYDAFGTVASIGTNLNKFQFSSEYYDSEVGCVYYNWRHYNPSLGEFLQVDPNTEVGFNLVTRNIFQRDYDDHSYVLSANNAIGFSDFIGLYSFSPFDGICNAEQKIKIAAGFAELLEQLQETIDMLEEKSKENGKTNRENICDCLNKAKALDKSGNNDAAADDFLKNLKKALEKFKEKAGTKSDQLWPIIKCRPNNYKTGMNEKMCDGNTMAYSTRKASFIEFCPKGIFDSDEYGGIKCVALHEMFHLYAGAHGGSDNLPGELMTVGFTKCIDDTCKGYEKK